MSIQINSLLYYCRSGYEADLANELDMQCAQHQLFGFNKFKPKQGFVEFSLFEPCQLGVEKSNTHIPSFEHLIFARQQLICMGEVVFSDMQDRIGEVLTLITDKCEQIPNFGDVFCEHAETEDGKKMAKFCKKFSVPLRQALRKKEILSKKPHSKLPFLHLFFESSEACKICVSLTHNRSSDYLGISRLKFPHDAPSRSTLKLEEAINKLLPKGSQDQILTKGMTSVDLGACPGGWTYQLVKRGIHVEAIDNGDIADSLMQTGLVKHFEVDGFAYKPMDGHVDWLVCDMIEKPQRVAKLMLDWLISRKTSSAIFNLKLPMQKRYALVAELLEMISKSLKEHDREFYIRAKHLYHDRDEITVAIVSGIHMVDIAHY